VNAQTNSEAIELVQAKSLEGKQGNQSYVKLKYDVVFKQGNMFLYCDSAFQYPGTNYVEALGRVRMVQGDTLNMTCHQLQYDGNTKNATARGNVVLIDKQTVLNTDVLQYNRITSKVYYTQGATIKDQDTRLKSVIGIYDTRTKQFQFKKQVVVENPMKGFKLVSDTLLYSSQNQLATFVGNTKITTNDGTIESDHGSFHTVTNVMYFGGRARVANGVNWIEADRIDYDDIKQIGVASGKVHIWNMKDSIHIHGQKSWYNGPRGITYVYGDPIMYQTEGQDTLFLKSDTLYYVNDTILKVKQLKAYHHVRLYRSTLQAVCDSLVYSFSDSVITFYKNPILWNDQTQLTSDTVFIFMQKNKIHRMEMHQNAFMISVDSIRNFNQVKGRNMYAYFVNGDIHRILVDGNAESIYHALEGDKKLIGVNRANAGAIQLLFTDKKLKSVTYITNPDAKFIPPHLVTLNDKKLKGFEWEYSKRPKRQQFNL
jgi:lipopolysaccharide export system protein LptA